jgi:thiosulfate/3-mercaptopyruvate sulfurtransferase
MLASTAWLERHLGDRGLVVVDMRWREDGSAPRLFTRGHLPGAVHIDWSTDLVDPDHRHAFMLAPPDRFARQMERCGIGDGSVVVAYADRLGSGPFRLWWACRAYGHHNVRILDGGFEKWQREGRPLSRSAPSGASTARWTPREGPALLARARDVDLARDDPSQAVLDSRPPEQFRGEFVWFETGPVATGAGGVARTARGDIRAGRIPWAANIPAVDLYRPDGTMKPPGELRDLLTKVGAGAATSRAITYCGVGISASALLFAARRAGIPDVRLYDGSWEEWGRSNRPVARG